MATAAPRSMRPERRALFWLALLLFLALALWLLKSILLPFVLGMAVAYLLDPLADRLTALGVPRTAAAALILVLFCGLGLLLVLLLLPAIVAQVTALVQALPVYFTAATASLRPLAERLLERLNAGQGGDLSQPLSLMQGGAALAAKVVNAALERGLALANSLALLALTPLVAFYLLRDWDRVVETVDGWLPRQQAEVIRAQLREIDRVLAGFARGTAIVCTLLGVYYAVALSLAGLNFGLVIGLTAGAVSFIPYVGTAFGLLASVGLALFQFWPHWGWILLVAGIFAVGQGVNDYVLVPRLVGQSVGLHPLWVMFGLFAGGALFGFVGLLIAVPLCAVVGVLTRFALSRYKESALYLGTPRPD